MKAAGGLMRRRGPGDEVQIAVVHRPAYDDWTFPKGKLAGGETPEQAALREVEEETGYRCELMQPLGHTAYVDGKGRDKVVDYWLMRPLSGRFQPGREVDELRWLTAGEARELLTYEHDRAMLRGAGLC